MTNVAKDIAQSGAKDVKDRIEIHQCDGRLGWPSESTDESYDVIHVGAAAPEIPKHFFNQLLPGGRLILPGRFFLLIYNIPPPPDIFLGKNLDRREFFLIFIHF